MEQADLRIHELFGIYPQLEWFNYHHIQDEEVRAISKKFSDLAWTLADDLHFGRVNRELSKGLDTLLQAKDCAVRAKIALNGYSKG